MSDEPDDLVLRYLRRIDAKLDRAAQDVRKSRVGMTSMEEIVAVSRRLDRGGIRSDRIERALDLVEQPH